ncbi:hypothetical protein KW868_02925 [Acinetobacter guillouiae]|uniref:Uncharacterized protein n=1 Tax=Acinetobacter guillouiae TaxID=106649 RepID=A0A8X8KDG2_ACIGI|nr:hypothetical protein [Acinetobacter guillouiae]MCF0263425.1 hypothetical protein [Acinetobacter guillouiae]
MINNKLISNLRKLNQNINQMHGEINYLTSRINLIKSMDLYVKGSQVFKKNPEEFIKNHFPFFETLFGVITIFFIVIIVCIVFFNNMSWWNLLWVFPLFWLMNFFAYIIDNIIYKGYCIFSSSVKFYKKSSVDIHHLEEEVKKLTAKAQQESNKFRNFIEQNVIPMVHESGFISLNEICHNLLHNLVNLDFLESILQKEADKGNLQKIKMSHNEVMYKSLINEPKIRKNYINYD